MIEDEVNRLINERIEASRLQDKLDAADPTALFQEADKERETIRSAPSLLPGATDEAQQAQQRQPIYNVVVSPPMTSNVNNGTATIDLDTTSALFKSRGVGGGGGGGGGGTTVRMIFLNAGVEETWDVNATQVS